MDGLTVPRRLRFRPMTSLDLRKQAAENHALRRVRFAKTSGESRALATEQNLSCEPRR